jgi:predicted glycoside hydrolase/deacetylase ChbG (UPF0249 family)
MQPASPSESRLVVNADDFGETEPITAGIATCIEKGSVTSTTILATMPATKRALAWAAPRSRDRNVSFGVHLDLCEGRALTSARSLVDVTGHFHRKRLQGLRALARRLDPADVEQELRAQIAFVRDAGVEISHLDSHKHLHQLPGVAAVVAHLAVEFDLERVRCTLEEGFWRPGIGVIGGLSRLARRRLARGFEAEARRAGLRHPARSLDVSQLMKLPTEAARSALLRRPGAVTEMFCHPGDERADREKPGSACRYDELRFLTSDDFPQLCRAAGVRLVSFWDV